MIFTLQEEELGGLAIWFRCGFCDLILMLCVKRKHFARITPYYSDCPGKAIDHLKRSANDWIQRLEMKLTPL